MSGYLQWDWFKVGLGSSRIWIWIYQRYIIISPNSHRCAFDIIVLQYHIWITSSFHSLLQYMSCSPEAKKKHGIMECNKKESLLGRYILRVSSQTTPPPPDSRKNPPNSCRRRLRRRSHRPTTSSANDLLPASCVSRVPTKQTASGKKNVISLIPIPSMYGIFTYTFTIKINQMRVNIPYMDPIWDISCEDSKWLHRTTVLPSKNPCLQPIQTFQALVGPLNHHRHRQKKSTKTHSVRRSAFSGSTTT